MIFSRGRMIQGLPAQNIKLIPCLKLSHIVGNKPVERLFIRDSCLNAASCPHEPRRSD